jgi:hypothetical protein
MSFQDISARVFGKYQHCTQYEGVFYADSDFEGGHGIGRPKKGAIPSPREEDRTPFGEPRQLPTETEAQKRERHARERAETNTLLERLAEEATPDVMAEQPALLAKYREAHEADSRSFSIDCRRHGDFLALFIERGGKKLVTSINLGASREIRLETGHAPDQDGETAFRFSAERDDGGAMVGGTNFGNYPAGAGYSWVVRPSHPWLPHERPLLIFDEPRQSDGGGMMWGGEAYEIRHRASPTARPAKDDRIRFEGVAATLFVPSGHGERVWTDLLAEIGKP